MADYLLDVANQTKHKSLLGIFCATCEVNFADEPEHKAHYKSDYHLFNLKRRMLQLAPITEAAFQKSLKEVLERSKNEKAKAALNNKKSCEVCWKEFKSAQTYQEHLKSKKHIQNEKNPVPKPEPKEITLTAENDLRVCFFCNLLCDDLDANLIHMEKEHGFFILEADFVKDKNGLLKEIVEQIFKDFGCLFCQFVKKKDWGSWRAAQTHMLEVGHCLMNPDYISYYSKHYDYSKALKDLKEKYGEHATADQAEGEDEEWEDLDDQGVPTKPQTSANGTQETDGATRQQWKQYTKKLFKKNEIGELVMPDGRTLGTRKYWLYYDQWLSHSFQRNFYTKALEDKLSPEEKEELATKSIVELKETYQNKVVELDERYRHHVRREFNKLQKMNQLYSYKLLRQRTRKDKRHNYTLNKHYVDRNMCTS